MDERWKEKLQPWLSAPPDEWPTAMKTLADLSLLAAERRMAKWEAVRGHAASP